MKRFYLPEAFEKPSDYTIPPDKELKNDTQHPELNSKTYRHEVAKFTLPKDYLRFFTCISQNTDGLFLLGTNEFTTNVFAGVSFGSQNFSDFIDKKITKSITSYAENIAGIYCLNNLTFIAATSTNKIELFNTKDSILNCSQGKICYFRVSTQSTDGEVNCLGKFNNRNRFIVGTSRGHFECYEFTTTDMFQSFTLSYGHHNKITGISTHPTEDFAWASTSYDRSCLLWDKKLIYPACALIEDHPEILTDVHWLNDKLVVLSDSAGDVMIYDTRKPKDLLCKKHVINRPITSLAFNGRKFGVVSESCNAYIYEIDEKNEINLIHEHNAHPNMLYSLCWNVHNKPNTYYVVGEEKYAKEITIN